jgi:hypothetical protein
MQLALDTEQQRFVAEVRRFLAEHWPPGARTAPGRPDLAFFAALEAAGWAVPDWPAAQGGTGWSAVQRYLFDREMVRAGAPQPDPLAVDVAGPLLLALGNAQQRQRWLPAIRGGRDRWQAHDSLSGGAVDRRQVQPVPAAQRSPAHQRRPADWLLGCLTRVPLGYSVGIFRLDPISGSPLRNAVLEDELALPDAQIVTNVLQQAAAIRRARAARLGRRLTETLRQIERLGDAAESTLRARVTALEIDLRALEMLELRSLQADGERLPGDALQAVIRIRSLELGISLATLALEALGYDALPAGDPLLQDNEALPGDLSGQDAIDDLLGYVGAFELLADRDRLAARFRFN